MRQVVGGAIIRHGTVLAARRTSPPATAGRWEFPGGKVEPGEGPEEALVRELSEELGCVAEPERWLAGTVPVGPGDELRVALMRLAAGEPVPRVHDRLRWLGPEQLDRVDWLEPDRPFLAELRERLLDGEPLAGGNVGAVVRIGETVRRPTGPWTPAVHAYLAHLRAAGLAGVPRVHGIDARGREVLDLIPGRVPDVDTELIGEAQLRDLARWLRDLHAAALGFEHPGPWRAFDVAAPTLIGHNDVAPYNVAFDGDRVAGVFDWDFAGPTTPLHELAHLAWNAVPLFRPLDAATAALRLRVLAEGYAGPDAETILGFVVERTRLAVDGIRTGGESLAGLLAAGEPERTERRLAALVERLPEIRARLAG